MRPAGERVGKETRPLRRAAPNFDLPYPPGRKPREREPDETEIFDPFEYIPHRYHAPNITLRPSNTPPTSRRYQIVDRVNDSNGLPKYILREVTTEEDGQKPKGNGSEEEGQNNGRPGGSSGQHGGASAPFDLVDFRLSALIHKPTSSKSGDDDSRDFAISYSKILSYVSAFELERFEHSRFENPTADDMPWLASQSSASDSLYENEISPGRRLRKRRRIGGPAAVIAERDTPLFGIGASAATSSVDTRNEGDEDYTSSEMGGCTEIGSNSTATSSLPYIYGMLERRPRSMSRLQDSANPSSKDVPTVSEPRVRRALSRESRSWTSRSRSRSTALNEEE